MIDRGGAGLLARLALAGLLLASACSREEEPDRAFPKGLGGPAAALDTGSADPGGGTRQNADVRPPDPGSAPAGGAGPGDAGSSSTGKPAPAENAQTGAAGWSPASRSGTGAGGTATQLTVRAARNQGYDRVVLELGPDAFPGWRVSYVDAPVRQCGSGEPVPLEGDAWLSVRLEPAQAHDDEGRATVVERSLRPGLPSLLELRLICDFEGQVEWVAAVRSPEPYRVLRLREPNRLVIDIRHPGG